ncbi:MAG TPA: 1-deoxy-D-xylulose-5-phosphate synthase N-terminal domain-containing protein [Candidatus Saccharimonadales bacterium]|nr:1-deoxy-D-xylulose-5-phosphate synthase N-terminal domain-containing protein [Candidatus Saccharimonadales bacterium]
MHKTLKELKTDSTRLRQIIIEQAAKDGGHVGPPLGAIEIIQALLEVYDFKHDKMFFDVGHQMHAYKILTDRANSFHTMDKKGGIAEFPNIHESPFDFYTGGHSGLSISAALGYAVNHSEYKSIALIGDGSMTGGQPYEALNHAGEIKPNVLVIYNENDFSITENTGFLHSGKKLRKFSESLGFQYKGVVDGHNLLELINILSEIKVIETPIFLHIRTIKGKGYLPAETDPIAFHSHDPFDIETGRPHKVKENSFRDLIIEKAKHLNNKYNDNLYLTSPAAARSSGLKELKQFYPNRVIDTGMNEQHCVTFSAAIALSGNKVICFIPAIFLPRALDQIIDVCLLKVPIVFVLLNPGIAGTGPTHQGIYTFPILNMLPNVEILNPANLADFDTLLDQSLEKDHPVFIQKPGENITHDPDISGTGVIRIRSGKQLTVVSIGNMLGSALKLADTLDGTEILHIERIKPLSMGKIAESASKTKRMLILEDGCVYSGMGEHIVSNLEEIDLDFKILGVKDKYPQLGNLQDVLDDVGLNDISILSAAKSLKMKK